VVGRRVGLTSRPPVSRLSRPSRPVNRDSFTFIIETANLRSVGNRHAADDRPTPRTDAAGRSSGQDNSFMTE
jgi:hypothetical protein